MGPRSGFGTWHAPSGCRCAVWLAYSLAELGQPDRWRSADRGMPTDETVSNQVFQRGLEGRLIQATEPGDVGERHWIMGRRAVIAKDTEDAAVGAGLMVHDTPLA